MQAGKGSASVCFVLNSPKIKIPRDKAESSRSIGEK